MSQEVARKEHGGQGHRVSCLVLEASAGRYMEAPQDTESHRSTWKEQGKAQLLMEKHWEDTTSNCNGKSRNHPKLQNQLTVLVCSSIKSDNVNQAEKLWCDMRSLPDAGQGFILGSHTLSLSLSPYIYIYDMYTYRSSICIWLLSLSSLLYICNASSKEPGCFLGGWNTNSRWVLQCSFLWQF